METTPSKKRKIENGQDTPSNNFDCYKELLSERKHKTKQSTLKDYFKK